MHRTRRTRPARRLIAAGSLFLLGAMMVACRGGSAVSAVPRADRYGQPAASPRLLAHESALLEDLNTRLQARQVPPALLDARLGNAAAALNALRADGRARDACDVGPGAVEAALQWTGVYERPVCQRCFWTRKGRVAIPSDVLQGLAECVVQDGAGQPMLGVHTLVSEGRTFVSALAVRRTAVLDPAERLVPLDRPVFLSGTLPAEGGPFRLLTAPSSGPVTVTPLQPDARQVFRVEGPPPGRNGSLTLGVLDGAGVERMRIRLWEASAAARATGVFDGLEDGVDMPVQDQAVLLRRAVTELRARAGLTPLRWSAALDAAAQQEVNQARPLTTWLERAPEPATLAAAQATGGAVRVFKLHGGAHGELTRLLASSPLHLHALTRPVDTSAGLGVAGVPRDGGRSGLAVVLLVSAEAPGALDP